MIYRLLKDGELVNTIEGSANFVSKYCAEMGYTYELREETKVEPAGTIDPETLVLDMLADHEERICMVELTTATTI